MAETKGTKEPGWGDTANCILGCEQDCLYCYGKWKMCYRYKRVLPENWSQMIPMKQALKKKWAPPKHPDNRYMFPTIHNIPKDNKPIRDICFQEILNILRAGHRLLLVLKPFYSVTKILVPLLHKYKTKVEIRLTITSCNNELLKFWEPNASLFEERVKCGRFLTQNEYLVSFSIEPFLDFDPCRLIRILSEEFPECEIWLGIMNHLKWVRENLKSKGFRWTDIPDTSSSDFEYRYSKEHLKSLLPNLLTYPGINFKDTFQDLADISKKPIPPKVDFIPANKLLEKKISDYF